MNRISLITALALSVAFLGQPAAQQLQPLPAPQTDSERSLERALAERRSNRRHGSEALSPALLGQLLWAAQGITGSGGKRTSPSAGARYPLVVYVMTPEGVFAYVPARHALRRVASDDRRAAVWKDTYARPWLSESPAVFVIAAAYERTRRKYGAKADRFVHIEAGHVGQNLLLQATALGLLNVPIGAFHQKRVKATLGIREEPVYFVVVGHPPAKDG